MAGIVSAALRLQLCEGPPGHAPGEVYRNDDHVYWGFTAASLDALAACAGFPPPDVLDTPVIDGHPRILATLDLDVSTGA